jgi:transcriptional regulator with XRE-family HTH domain
LLRTEALDNIQKELGLNEQDFAEHLDISRAQLWRARLNPEDKRFSLGQDFIAKILDKLKRPFEEIFFLDQVSQACYTPVIREERYEKKVHHPKSFTDHK